VVKVVSVVKVAPEATAVTVSTESAIAVPTRAPVATVGRAALVARRQLEPRATVVSAAMGVPVGLVALAESQGTVVLVALVATVVSVAPEERRRAALTDRAVTVVTRVTVGWVALVARAIF
jgi:hypothetical protein